MTAEEYVTIFQSNLDPYEYQTILRYVSGYLFVSLSLDPLIGKHSISLN